MARGLEGGATTRASQARRRVNIGGASTRPTGAGLPVPLGRRHQPRMRCLLTRQEYVRSGKGGIYSSDENTSLFAFLATRRGAS